MSRRLIDLTGRRFGRLQVRRRSEQVKHKEPQWLCLCDCGTERVVPGGSLRGGRTQSCGCWGREVNAERKEQARKARALIPRQAKLPPIADHPLYPTYSAMRQRCGNRNSKGYQRYGGRGITICERWQGTDGFPNFLSDMGKKPSPKHSIDRIDNDGNYEPDNCRWATRSEQSNNSCRNRLVEIGGIRMTLVQASRATKVRYSLLLQRLNRGWSIERAVLTPPK